MGYTALHCAVKYVGPDFTTKCLFETLFFIVGIIFLVWVVFGAPSASFGKLTGSIPLRLVIAGATNSIRRIAKFAMVTRCTPKSCSLCSTQKEFLTKSCCNYFGSRMTRPKACVKATTSVPNIAVRFISTIQINRSPQSPRATFFNNGSHKHDRNQTIG